MSIISLKSDNCFNNWYDCENKCSDECMTTTSYGSTVYCCYGDLIGVATAIIVISIVVPVIIAIVAAIVGICCCLRARKQHNQQIVITNVPAGGRPQQVYVQNGQGIVYAQPIPAQTQVVYSQVPVQVPTAPVQ